MVSTESKDPPLQGTNPDWSKERTVTVTSQWKTKFSGDEEGVGQVETRRNWTNQGDEVEPQEDLKKSEKEQNVI